MSNVIQFPKKAVILTDDQRTHLATSISGMAENPEAVVSRLEAEVCIQVVAAARKVGALLAERFGATILKLIQ